MLPLVAREMRIWLDGSSERVVALHCKGTILSDCLVTSFDQSTAGKGRSGTMACAYLLSLEDAPSPPSIEQSRTRKEEAKSRAEELMNTMPNDDSVEVHLRAEHVDASKADPVKQELDLSSGASSPSISSQTNDSNDSRSDSSRNKLAHVLDLHTRGRMRRPSSPAQKPKQGVSIPSQRRWLYYWSLLLVHQGPLDFWSVNPEVLNQPPPKVRLTHVTVRMRELSGVESGLVRVAHAVLNHTSFGKAKHLSSVKNASSHVWVSLARYKDEFVNELEEWEKRTRADDGSLGKRKPGSDHVGDESLSDMFRTDRWDGSKMVQSFARLGTQGEDDVSQEVTQVRRELLGATILCLLTWR